MKKRLILIILFLLALNGCSRENDSQDENSHSSSEEENISIKVFDEGECIYNPGDDYGYRYGPSLIMNGDGSIDAWFARPGNSSTMWDYISYRHRYPNGEWSDEEIVLYPTEGSLDGYSVCDPGVIYFDGYYYLGYTSTVSSDGYRNQVFVARSEEPNGYYEKWNGSGWGGYPQPIIAYDGDQWGAGEVSFVIEGSEVLCYYTWKDTNEDTVRCSKALMSEDWPANLSFRCVALNRAGAQCSSDIVYLEDYGMYLSFSIMNRMQENSCLCVQYSKDGRDFDNLIEIDGNINQNAHNLGVSKHSDGHIELEDDMYICYAYSEDNVWGKWKTYFQPISIDQ